MLIEVNIKILPDGTRKRARIDTNVSLEKTKSDLVKALGLGEPEEFDIAISPRSTKIPWLSQRISQDDVILLIRKDSHSGSSVEILG